jgi:7,8-dihydroneopterin 2',3'-cyclic phosphate phosphodiesterase
MLIMGEAMEKLIELARGIKDEELRKKVIDFLKNPSLTHKDFKKYPKEDVAKVKTPFSIAQVGTVERDLLNHTIAVTDLCMKTAESMEKNYGIKINRDHLLAGALLHDIMKIFEWKVGEEGAEPTGVLLDHSMLAVAEFYYRGFPEDVIHIIASHFGESGPTPPRNYEALILHYVDTLLSLTEFHLYGVKQEKQPVQLLLLDEETMKKIKDETKS